ncbi:MAG: Flavobacterium phage [Bacteroidota bacterium]|jgi:hypothetical protein
MNVFELAKRDAKLAINTNSFDIEMLTPNKQKVIYITGWAIKHHISFDSDGNQVNTKFARITVDENVLVANGITVRNAKGSVDLDNYKVKFKDSSGVLRSYSVREVFPDQYFGLIILVLEDAII